jgi:hypothetical protein
MSHGVGMACIVRVPGCSWVAGACGASGWQGLAVPVHGQWQSVYTQLLTLFSTGVHAPAKGFALHVNVGNALRSALTAYV